MMIRFILLGASEFVASLYSSTVMRKLLVLEMSGMFLIFLEFVRLKRIVLFWLRDEKVYWICGFQIQIAYFKGKPHSFDRFVRSATKNTFKSVLSFNATGFVQLFCFVCLFLLFFFTLFNWLKEKQQLIA